MYKNNHRESKREVDIYYVCVVENQILRCKSNFSHEKTDWEMAAATEYVDCGGDDLHICSGQLSAAGVLPNTIKPPPTTEDAFIFQYLPSTTVIDS